MFDTSVFEPSDQRRGTTDENQASVGIYEYHRRSAADKGPCSICGLPLKGPGFSVTTRHRAVAESEGLPFRFMARATSPAGWREWGVCPLPTARKQKPAVVNPCDWHRRPAGNSGCCAICSARPVKFRHGAVITGSLPIPRESLSFGWSVFVRLPATIRARGRKSGFLRSRFPRPTRQILLRPMFPSGIFRP